MDCYGGFGYRLDNQNRTSCWSLVLGDHAGSSGSLTPLPGTLNSSEVVNELNLLMTSGRLNAERLQLLEQAYEATNSTEGHDRASIKVQQLILTTPEFHTTGRATPNDLNRTEPTIPAPSTNQYKAVVFLMLKGGCDSYNMIVPHNCTGNNLVHQYEQERGELKLTLAERQANIIDVAGQPCEQFALHPELRTIKDLYVEGDLAFYFNTGVLNAASSKSNYEYVTETRLFAHDTMQREAKRGDPYNLKLNSGVLGRLADALTEHGFQPNAISIDAASVAVTGYTDATVSPTIVSRDGVVEFNQRTQAERDIELAPEAKLLNGRHDMSTSSIFCEAWSARFSRALWETEVLQEILDFNLPEPHEGTITLPTPPDENLAKSFEMILKLMMTRDARGSDRDVFYVSIGGFDTHDDMKDRLTDRFQELDQSLEWFHHHLQDQGLWDNVTIVSVSDFGRTMTPNSGQGSDHGWGGNYFVAGGSVKGGQGLCNYPSDITADSPLNVGRGRMLPECAWESMWHPVMDWMFDGFMSTIERDSILVNARKTGAVLYNMTDLFK